MFFSGICHRSTVAQASSSCGTGSPDDLSELGCHTSTSSTTLTSVGTGLESSLDSSTRLGRIITQLQTVKLEVGKSANSNKNDKSDSFIEKDGTHPNQKLTSESLGGDSGMTPSQKVGALLKNRKIAREAICGSKTKGSDSVKDNATNPKNVEVNPNKKRDSATPNPHILPEHVPRLQVEVFFLRPS